MVKPTNQTSLLIQRYGTPFQWFIAHRHDFRFSGHNLGLYPAVWLKIAPMFDQGGKGKKGAEEQEAWKVTKN
jgi:hypothetical protein